VEQGRSRGVQIVERVWRTSGEPVESLWRRVERVWRTVEKIFNFVEKCMPLWRNIGKCFNLVEKLYVFVVPVEKSILIGDRRPDERMLEKDGFLFIIHRVTR